MVELSLSPHALAATIAEQRALWKHFARHWYVYLPLLFVYLWALGHIGVNWTPSLPYRARLHREAGFGRTWRFGRVPL